MPNMDEFLQRFRDLNPEGKQLLLEETKGLITRAKSSQTRALNSAKKWLEKAKSIPLETAQSELKVCIENLRSSIRNLENEILKFVNMTAGPEADAYEKDFQKRYEEAEEFTIHVCEKVQSLMTAASISASARNQSDARVQNIVETSKSRPIQDLKPHQLEYSASPNTFKAWSDDIIYYFDASKFNLEPVHVQQGYFFACLSDTAKSELKSRVSRCSRQKVPPLS